MDVGTYERLGDAFGYAAAIEDYWISADIGLPFYAIVVVIIAFRCIIIRKILRLQFCESHESIFFSTIRFKLV